MRARQGLESAVDKCIDIKALMFVACSDASAAKDALFRIPHDAWIGFVFLCDAFFTCVWYFPYAKICRDRLKFAVIVLLACEAFLGMVREQELNDRLSRFPDKGGVRMDDHSVRDRIYTSGAKPASTFYVNYTYPACSLFAEL
jgi:hypothetical protein